MNTDWVRNNASLSERVKALADGTETYKQVRMGKYKKLVWVLCKGQYEVPLIAKRKPANARSKVMAACRELVQSQIATFRQTYWAEHVDCECICPLSGADLRKVATHVDHVKPFVKLVEAWLADKELSCNDLQVVKSRKLGRYTLGSAALDKSWQDYHAQHAQLQLTEARANMRKGANIMATERTI